MKISDELLMAYADGELDLVARAEIEAAMAADPAIARVVERHRALSTRVRDAYREVLDEPVPERLAKLVQEPPSAQVVDLAAKRGEREAARAGARRWGMPQWSALAASLALGLLVGLLVTRSPSAPYEETTAGLVARGGLDQALDTQLAATGDASAVQVGLSFRSRDGAYCRSFHLQRATALAGLACRAGDEWRLEVLAAAAQHEGELRTAAAMPMAVLQAIDAAIDGEPLDAAAEIAARDAGWQLAN